MFDPSELFEAIQKDIEKKQLDEKVFEESYMPTLIVCKSTFSGIMLATMITMAVLAIFAGNNGDSIASLTYNAILFFLGIFQEGIIDLMMTIPISAFKLNQIKYETLKRELEQQQ